MTIGSIRRFGIAAGVLALLASCGTEEEQQSAAPPPPEVTVAKPLVQQIVDRDEFTGRFNPAASVDVRARVSGYLDKIAFTDGQMVKTGDLLFVIDQRPFQNALHEAEADLASAKARQQLAVTDLERSRALVSSSAVAKATFDQRLQDKQIADAGVLAAEAALDKAKLDLEFTEVRAPLDGRISRRLVDIGNLVSGEPAATVLTTIVALDPIYFDFDMSETEFLAYSRAAAEGRMASQRDGKVEVALRLPDEKEWTLTGTLDFLDNRIDPASGTMRARAIVQNPGLFLTPGQFGRLGLPGSEPYQAILVPDRAVVSDQARKLLMTVDEEGTVQAKVIRPGPLHDGLRVVREGITADDDVIIDGLVRARPGEKVTPQAGTVELAANED
ncbi:efflux RND transporter periplasmic adaptor subunit [Geminicoccus roseus]|uniref:efflux RND transporter periplasmic adaptor subunit n=1 Tax=Geminicoccus roseus TaxID=404900 RepID=UPI000406091E|nr:efflux RND transporter periplasmic adaptor subunit [Geminicoccus roseus]